MKVTPRVGEATFGYLALVALNDGQGFFPTESRRYVDELPKRDGLTRDWERWITPVPDRAKV